MPRGSFAVVGTATAALAVGLLAPLGPARAADPGLTVIVVNENSAVSDADVFVMAQAGGTELVAAPESLSQRDRFTVAGIRSGRVFVSLGEPLPAVGEPSPDTSPVRYDTVELTYPGVANLTAVDMFGIPLDLEVFDTDGQLVGAKRWRCTTDVVTAALAQSVTAAGGDFARTQRTDSAGQFLRLVSPNIVSGPHPSGYPTFERYLASLSEVPLTIRGTALGRDYHYTGAFTPDPDDPHGVLRLTDQGPDHLDPMEVTGASLIGNGGDGGSGIYGNNSAYLVGGRPGSGNDVYAAAYRDLVAGFAYGFWGSPDYGNDSGRFDVATAPGPFAAAQPDAPFYNVWAATLWPLTDAYGFPYGDTFNHSAERNPIVELPIDGTLRITIRSDVSPPGCAPSVPAPVPSAQPGPDSPSHPATPPSASPPADQPAAGRPPARLMRPGRVVKPVVRREGRRWIRVMWQAPVPAAQRFAIQAKARSRCSVARTSATSHRLPMRRAWSGHTVKIRVVARNAGGNGEPSRIATVRVPAGTRGAAGVAGGRSCVAVGW